MPLLPARELFVEHIITYAARLFKHLPGEFCGVSVVITHVHPLSGSLCFKGTKNSRQSKRQYQYWKGVKRTRH